MNVIGSPGNTGRNPFVALMVKSICSVPSVDYRPYAFRRSLSGWPDIWHLNWPDAAYRSRSVIRSTLKCVKLIVQIDLARARGTRVLWMVHNLKPHLVNHHFIESVFWKAFIRRVDGFAHLSDAGGAWFRQVYETRDDQLHFHLRHPVYPMPTSEDHPSPAPDETPIRLLMFGSILPYKMYPEGIRSFRNADTEGSELLVVGKPVSEEIRARILESTSGDPRISLLLHPPSNDELEAHLRACSGVVVPATNFLNSGSLLMALSRHRPALVASTPVTRELRSDIGAEWVHLYEPELDESDLRRFIQAISRPRDPDLSPDLTKYQWADFGTALVEAYHTLSSAR